MIGAIFGHRTSPDIDRTCPAGKGTGHTGHRPIGAVSMSHAGPKSGLRGVRNDLRQGRAAEERGGRAGVREVPDAPAVRKSADCRECLRASDERESQARARLLPNQA